MVEQHRSAGAAMISERTAKGEPVDIDYSPFLHVQGDGTIWWPLADAVKLGAGYLPLRDDDRDLNPVLRAKSNRVRSNERTLFSEFSPEHYTHAHPRILERDDGRYVEAREFLNWLSQHLAAQPESAMLFPDDLSRAVRKATGAPIEHSTVLPIFESLTVALAEWFGQPLAELPDALRQRVEQEFCTIPWDKLSTDRRRSVTRQLDYQRDPEHPDCPPLTSGFFVLSQVEQIEAEDFAGNDDAQKIPVDVVQPFSAVAIDPSAVKQPEVLQPVGRQKDSGLGSPEWRKENARAAANARHNLPGGSRDKQRKIREIWASGKYASRDICAEQECAALEMSFTAARKALKNLL